MVAFQSAWKHASGLVRNGVEREDGAEACTQPETAIVSGMPLIPEDPKQRTD